MNELADDHQLQARADELGGLLRDHGLCVATAESCTGGWIGKVFTDSAGSSDYFIGSLVTYSNNLKQLLLDVPGDLLQQHGAVSESAVRQMALGARRRTGADLTVAVTGVAGPGGGSVDKPVGTVWLAWANQNDEITTVCQRFGGDREQVRRQTVMAALSGFYQLVAD